MHLHSRLFTAGLYGASSSSGPGISTGAIIGIVAGAVAVVLVMIIVSVSLVRKRSRLNQQNTPQKYPPNQYVPQTITTRRGVLYQPQPAPHTCAPDYQPPSVPPPTYKEREDGTQLVA
ncbi:uncharacterized protein CXQ87_003413 [Candidozyma duobushaemuli]|uniref:Uncharacterized protein n=1 Tax=Candidozyma duobushaemuli TaxID=1231522 RepID=A0A2V1AC25_9ASCO|nr:uncharacterized protein CXQ87_003413 [[Candida] duobushaemulonis]PVH15569.1 hypothetical protein CXQ87_003413 [[Candida] duobushaemulonis]